MKFYKSKLLTSVSAVALMLAVGACSSNGDNDDSAERDTALEQLKGELADANAEVMRLEGVIGDETDPTAESLRGQLAAANARIGSAEDPDSLEGMLAAEQAEVMRLDGLLGDEAAPADDSVRGMLAVAKTQVMRLDGLLAAARAEINNDDPLNLGLMQQLADANKKLDDRDKEVARLERIARGQGIASALLANRVGTMRGRVGTDGMTLVPTSQLPFTTAASVTAAEHGVSAKRTSGGVVTVSLGLTGTEAVKFSGDDSNAGATWTRAIQTRTLVDSEETVVVYTDIDAPTATLLASEFVGTGMNQRYVVVEANDVGALARIIPSKAPVAGDPETLEYDANEKFRGTYRDIAGEFTCDEDTAPARFPRMALGTS